MRNIFGTSAVSDNSERKAYLEKLAKKREEFEHKQRAIFNAGQSAHSHAEITDWLKCFPCAIRRKEQIAERQKLGLADPKKYHNWRKKNTAGYDHRVYVANELNLQFGAKDARPMPKGVVTII